MQNLGLLGTAGYFAESQVAFVEAKPLFFLITGLWLVFPFAIQTAVFPQDAAAIVFTILGRQLPLAFTRYDLDIGFDWAVAVIALIVVAQYLGMRAFYARMRQFSGAPATWPGAIIMTGIVGNCIWWFTTGIDLNGIVVGFAPTALAYGCETVCEYMAKKTA